MVFWWALSTILAELRSTALKRRIGSGALVDMTTIRGICRDDDYRNFLAILFPEMYASALGARGEIGALVGKRPLTIGWWSGPEQAAGSVDDTAPPAPGEGLPYQALMEARVNQSINASRPEIYMPDYDRLLRARVAMDVAPSMVAQELIESNDAVAVGNAIAKRLSGAYPTSSRGMPGYNQALTIPGIAELAYGKNLIGYRTNSGLTSIMRR